MWPTAPGVGSRHTESTLSHVVAAEDQRLSKQLCHPSRGFSDASALLSPHGCRRGPHSCPRPGGLRNPIEPIVAPMGDGGRLDLATHGLEAVKKSPRPVIPSEARNLHLFVFKEIKCRCFASLSMTDDFFTPSYAVGYTLAPVSRRADSSNELLTQDTSWSPGSWEKQRRATPGPSPGHSLS